MGNSAHLPCLDDVTGAGVAVCRDVRYENETALVGPGRRLTRQVETLPLVLDSNVVVTGVIPSLRRQARVTLGGGISSSDLCPVCLLQAKIPVVLRDSGKRPLTCQIFICTPLAGLEPASRQKLVPARRTAVDPSDTCHSWLGWRLQLLMLCECQRAVSLLQMPHFRPELWEEGMGHWD